MKVLQIFLILLFCSALYGFTSWTELQRDLSLQAAAYRNSPQHQMIRQSRETRSYNVGDTKTFWRWNLSIMPPSWIQTPATCRAVGEHSYIFVADSEWNLHINQANVDTILVRLEDNTPNNPNQGAIEMDISLFGDIPDELDNDPRLIVFYSALGSFQGTSFDGYFSAYNQVTEAEAQLMNPPGHSNECEMIYMTCYPLSPIAPIRLSVLAHELQHLIHWGQDANEQTWLNEGCSELAMVAYGIPDPISGFNTNPDNSLIVWNQVFADYVKVMLFFTYLQEHYDNTGLIRNLVADANNGIPSLEFLLAFHYPEITLGELFRDWTIANYLDEPQPGDGLYNYTQLSLPVFYSSAMSSSGAVNLTVSPYAADYLSLVNPSQSVSFSIQGTTPVYVSAMLFDSMGICTEVMSGDPVNQIDFTSLAGQAARVVFAVTNPNPATASYSYSLGPVDLDDPEQVMPIPELSCYPNPFKAGSEILSIQIGKPKSQISKLEIFNLKGQMVRSLDTSFTFADDQYQLSWDGLDANGRKVPSGVYLVRYQQDKHNLSKKVSLIW